MTRLIAHALFPPAIIEEFGAMSIMERCEGGRGAKYAGVEIPRDEEG